MIDYWIQILLQGILEAFPISSSMHLKTFNIANVEILHLGTGLAFFFFSLEYLYPYIKKPTSKKTISFLFKIFLLTLPTIAIGFIIKKQCQIISINAMNSICALIMLIVNIKSSSNKHFNSLKIKEIITIGLIISLALIPGASRFGITFTAFRIFNLTEQESFLFTIIVGIPITIGAATLSIVQSNVTPSIITASFFAGAITYQTLKITKKYLRYWNIFSIYRIIFSLIHICLNTTQKKTLITYIMIILCTLFKIEPNENKHTIKSIQKNKNIKKYHQSAKKNSVNQKYL